MPDVASKVEGGRVVMVSSLDADHPGENIIDGSDMSYWMSTGLYPQEILLALAYPCLISAVRLAATRVRAVRIEGCPEDPPLNFHAIAEGELCDSHGLLQVQELPCSRVSCSIEFIRVVILSGWHDFCSVHGVRVDAIRVGPAVSRCSEQPSVMELRVRHTSGSSCTISAKRSWTLAEVKGVVEGALGIPRAEQKLWLGTRELADADPAGGLPSVSGADITVARCDQRRAQWLAQVSKDGLALRFAADLQADPEVAHAAVVQDGDALQFVSAELQADRGIVFAAVRQKGTAIVWAAEALRADREVALAAVRQSGNALQGVAEELTGDREVVMAAVKRKGSALRWASHELRGDDEVVAVASANFYFTREELAQLRSA